MKDSARKIWVIGCACVLVAALAAFPAIRDKRIGFGTAILLQLFLYVYLAQAWNLVGGITGLFSLGHSVFFGIGAYSLIVATNKLHLSPWWGVAIGIGLCLIVAVVIGMTSSRLSGLFFAMFTIGLIKIMLDISVQWTTVTGGSQGITTPKSITINTTEAYYIFLGMCVLAVLVCGVLRRARIGTLCASIRENEVFAKSLGVRVGIAKISMVTISALMVCIAGFVFAMYIRGIYPTMAFSFAMSTKMIIVALIGGPGTVVGPLLGGFVIVIDELIRAWLGSAYGGISYIVYGAVLIIIINALPKGIIGIMKGKKEKTVGTVLKQKDA